MFSENHNVTPIKNLPKNGQRAFEEAMNSFCLNLTHLRKHNIFIKDEDKASRIAISAYKSMRTHVLREMQKQKISSLMVTGATENVGKTTTSVNLAISISKHIEKRVILVDFDFRKPSFGEIFDLNIDYGVDNILDDDFVLGRAMQRTDIPRLFVLPCAQTHYDSTELLISSRMQQLMTMLRKREDNLVVIFDTPPILGCDDVPALCEMMDACLLVVGEGSTNREELQRAHSLLGDLPVLATVLNRSTEADFERYYY